jgi:hypothetical protein
MILLAYVCLLVVAAFLIRGGAFHLSRRSEFLARLLGMIGATATASIAVALIATNHQTNLGLVAVIMLLSGSLLYLCGLVLWRERAGFALRLIGWIVTVSALAIPSTLTLLLPLAALLALTLRAAPESRTLTARH